MTTISVIHVFLTTYLTGSAYTNCLTPSHGRSILMTLIVPYLLSLWGTRTPHHGQRQPSFYSDTRSIAWLYPKGARGSAGYARGVGGHLEFTPEGVQSPRGLVLTTSVNSTPSQSFFQILKDTISVYPPPPFPKTQPEKNHKKFDK